MFARAVRISALIQLVLGAGAGVWVALLACPSWVGVVLLPLLCVAVLAAFPHLVIVLATMALSGSPAAGRWRAILGEWGTMLWVFWVGVPWSDASPTYVRSSLPDSSRLPIVLVHGFFCNHKIWTKMAHVLRRAGHDVLAVDLEPLFAPIDDYVPTVEQAIATVLERSHAPRAILVGHSMGGLVIRAWMRTHGAARADRVLTLGSPHWGTWLARVLPFAANCRQMMQRSNWLHALHASESPETWERICVAKTQHDNIVFPNDAPLPTHPVDTIFTGVGHMQLCFDDAVVDWVVLHCQGSVSSAGFAR